MRPLVATERHRLDEFRPLQHLVALDDADEALERCPMLLGQRGGAKRFELVVGKVAEGPVEQGDAGEAGFRSVHGAIPYGSVPVTTTSAHTYSRMRSSRRSSEDPNCSSAEPTYRNGAMAMEAGCERSSSEA